VCADRSEEEREHIGFSLNDTFAHRVENQLRRIVQVELFEDVAPRGAANVNTSVSEVDVRPLKAESFAGAHPR
jgi:hypothetical protein